MALRQTLIGALFAGVLQLRCLGLRVKTVSSVVGCSDVDVTRVCTTETQISACCDQF